MQSAPIKKLRDTAESPYFLRNVIRKPNPTNIITWTSWKPGHKCVSYYINDQWGTYLDKSWASCCGDDPHLDHTLLHSDVCILTGSHTWRYLLFFFIRNSKIVNDEKNFIIFFKFPHIWIIFWPMTSFIKRVKVKSDYYKPCKCTKQNNETNL